MKIKATVRILREGPLDQISHAFHQLLGQTIKLRLVSLDIDPVTKEGKLSTESTLSLWGGSTDNKSDTLLQLSFWVDSDFGKPGAILLSSKERNEIYLKSVTLHKAAEDGGDIYFPCYTWINHRDLYFGESRVFFPNQPLLPHQTPAALLKYRQHDLQCLRGDGTGERVHGQRVYDYDLYNDLGNPDDDIKLKRSVLGGSSEFPYPRRCRTGRKRAKADGLSEEPMTSFDGSYLPRDERFSALKKQLFMEAGVRSLGHNAIVSIANIIFGDSSFETFDDIYDLYVGDLKETYNIKTMGNIVRKPTDGTPLEFPPPGVVQADKDAWKSDAEFGRQRLAGLNPMVIQRLQTFPPISTLDAEVYGDPTSAITEAHLEPLLEGFSVKEALDQNLLYILDYHDAFMPYINKINELNGKTYASRTILYLTKARKLVPIAIELTLPPKKKGDDATKRVFTPNKDVCPDRLWKLAKSHVLVVDTGYHQLVSHWLRTHACVEPIILATKRQLSMMHPIHMLLLPHFKDTLHINALARSSLINAGGKIEEHYTPGKYCMEMSSVVYKSWRFDEESLPKDLLKRGMAVEDESTEHGMRLTIEDYPYAVDGLELWKAMKGWVGEYVELYYGGGDADVEGDKEVQAWWQEIQKVGHGDHAHATWWPSLKTIPSLVDSLTTIIWLASAHHAAVNFGQYAYAGYMPNNPCLARALIPEPGTPQYSQILSQDDPSPFKRFFLNMVPTQGQTTLAMAVLEILAQHMSEEEYLGERKDEMWTSDPGAVEALKRFKGRLTEVEAKIEARNKACDEFPHRAGAVLLPYTLLAPGNAGPGLTFRGVPNSISI